MKFKYNKNKFPAHIEFMGLHYSQLAQMRQFIEENGAFLAEMCYVNKKNAALQTDWVPTFEPDEYWLQMVVVAKNEATCEFIDYLVRRLEDQAFDLELNYIENDHIDCVHTVPEEVK